MKKIIIMSSLGIIGLVILVESHILEALLSLLLAGVIPGTPFTIPSGVMLVILVSIAWLVIFRFLTTTGTDALSTKQPTPKGRLATKKQLPKRRYKQA